MPNIIFFIFFTIAIVSYMKVYFKKKNDFRIIQTNVSDLHPSMLCEKYPIYIDDRIVNIEELLMSIFKYETLFKKYLRYAHINTSIKTKCKFTLIHNNNDNIANLYIKNEYDYVQIKLYPYNTFVIPLHWEYKIDSECDITELNDFFHKLFFY
jgi:hypothetical protein|tara:strand:+ start:3393 stop:3851 length:459 start_codon:yes stop_codon:yes gene_type:complete